MPDGWRTIQSLVHKIRLHGRRGKGMAESFSREKLRQAPQKEGGWKILCVTFFLCDPGWYVHWSPEWMGRKHTHTQNSTSRSTRERNGWILLARKIKARTAEGRWMKTPVWSSPVWPRLVRPTNLVSRMNGKKTPRTHSITVGFSPTLYCWPNNVTTIGEPV